MTIYVLLPLLLTVGIAFATQWSLGARSTVSLGRVALIAAAAQLLLTALTVGLVLVSLDQLRDERCPLGELEVSSARVLLFATAIAGGVVLASVIADGRRQRGVLVWHLLASPAAVVLSYVVLSALFYWGLTCTS